MPTITNFGGGAGGSLTGTVIAIKNYGKNGSGSTTWTATGDGYVVITIKNDGQYILYDCSVKKNGTKLNPTKVSSGVYGAYGVFNIPVTTGDIVYCGGSIPDASRGVTYTMSFIALS